jgi:hypothetical protein
MVVILNVSCEEVKVLQRELPVVANTIFSKFFCWRCEEGSTFNVKFLQGIVVIILKLQAASHRKVKSMWWLTHRMLGIILELAAVMKVRLGNIKSLY